VIISFLRNRNRTIVPVIIILRLIFCWTIAHAAFADSLSSESRLSLASALLPRSRSNHVGGTLVRSNVNCSEIGSIEAGQFESGSTWTHKRTDLWRNSITS